LPSMWGRQLGRTAVALFAVLCLAAICLGGLYLWDPALTRSIGQEVEQTVGGGIDTAERFVGYFFVSAPASEPPAQPSATPSR
jgi:hypothetical protein